MPASSASAWSTSAARPGSSGRTGFATVMAPPRFPERRRRSFRVCFRVLTRRADRACTSCPSRTPPIHGCATTSPSPTSCCAGSPSPLAGSISPSRRRSSRARSLRATSRGRCCCSRNGSTSWSRCCEPFDVPVYLADAAVLEQRHRLRDAPRRPRLDAPAAAARGRRAAARRPPRRRARGHRRSHQRRRDLPRRRGARRGRGARHAALRRPVLPPSRAGQHGHGAAGAVDPARGVAARCRAAARGGIRDRGPRARSTPPSTSRSSRGIHPSGSPCCSAPRATG